MRVSGATVLAAVLALWGLGAAAQDLPAQANSYGMPGLIEMPGAGAFPDGEIGYVFSSFARQNRHSLTFQITPRLTGAFRYALLYDIASTPGAPPKDFRYDRSFSLHYQVVEESAFRPSLAIGLTDLAGTALYAGEYVVASKSLGPRLRVTGGIGWGRLASAGGFANPLALLDDSFATRPPSDWGEGGNFQPGMWFRGPAALFGGLEWQANDRLALIAEYSSDAYLREDPGAFQVRVPLNLALRYRLGPGAEVQASYLYGSEIGVQARFTLDPRRGRFGSGRDGAPPVVVPRAQAGPGAMPTGADFAAEGLRLLSLELAGDAAHVTVENIGLPTQAQAIGRAARLLTMLPPRVSHLQVTLTARGMPVSTTTVSRADLEALEFAVDGPERLFANSLITDAAPLSALVAPRLDWRLEPYLTPSLFDPDAPLRADLGLALTAEAAPLPGLILSGTLQQKLAGNLDQGTRSEPSPLPHVRTDLYDYYRGGPLTIPRLQAAIYARPGRNLFARATVGLLEPMFGGLSAEVLWKPDNRRWALGIEANALTQRDYEQMFGFQDYRVLSGHASAYADFGGGYLAQLDAGRYLAGDWGATLTLDREFANGWKVGVFATLTNVSFEDFGEGSFDKGLRLTIPLAWVTGRQVADRAYLTIRPVTRDGGARVDVDGRLYDLVRGLQRPALQDGWSRVWR